jgi:hypothetical protein
MSTAQLILGNNPAFQLASALEAVRKAEEDFAGQKADHKARMEALYADVNRLKLDILTGQKQLPLEPMTPEQLAADPVISEGLRGLQKLADEDGTTLSVRFDDGEEVVLARPKSDIPSVLDAENEDTKVGL